MSPERQIDWGTRVITAMALAPVPRDELSKLLQRVFDCLHRGMDEKPQVDTLANLVLARDLVGINTLFNRGFSSPLEDWQAEDPNDSRPAYENEVHLRHERGLSVSISPSALTPGYFRVIVEFSGRSAVWSEEVRRKFVSAELDILRIWSRSLGDIFHQATTGSGTELLPAASQRLQETRGIYLDGIGE